MAVERTLSIIKPDATRRNLTGQINARFEEAGLRIVAQKRIHLTRAQANSFIMFTTSAPFSAIYATLCRRGRSSSKFWKVKMRLLRTGKSWGQQTPQMPMKGQSEKISASRLRRIRHRFRCARDGGLGDFLLLRGNGDCRLGRISVSGMSKSKKAHRMVRLMRICFVVLRY